MSGHGSFPKVWLRPGEKTTNTALSIRPANSLSRLSSHRVGDFSEGLAAVQPVDAGWPGNLAYINHKGEIVIKSMSTFPNSPMRAEFDLHHYRFCGGVAWVSTGNEADADADGYINQEGKFIWPQVTPSKKE